jgi:hypothetical protein
MDEFKQKRPPLGGLFSRQLSSSLERLLCRLIGAIECSVRFCQCCQAAASREKGAMVRCFRLVTLTVFPAMARPSHSTADVRNQLPACEMDLDIIGDPAHIMPALAASLK